MCALLLIDINHVSYDINFLYYPYIEERGRLLTQGGLLMLMWMH